jgi:DNA-binding XRE family transcriptional regulator
MACLCGQDPCGCACVPVNAPKKVATDYFMYVGTTGIVFVTTLTGTVLPSGVVFDPSHERNALWHAASDLADMGMIDGQTLRFIREAIPWTITETASFLGVSDATVMAWEANQEVIPREMWVAVAQVVRGLAQEQGPSGPLAPHPPDLRPRTIRIHVPVSTFPVFTT